MKLPEALVFMKVGSHAGETFESILERKKREYQNAGCIFWGYGGPTMHPLKQVRPFMKTILKDNNSIHLFMEAINSRANPNLVPATEYSEDGSTWKPIPDGISVTGSRYALVLDEIKPGDLDIPLEQYEVALGPSHGKLAIDYITGHIDKACLIRSSQQVIGQTKVRRASFSAKLLDPYAVLVR